MSEQPGPTTPHPPHRTGYWRGRPRLMASVGVFVLAVGLMLALGTRPVLALLLGFDVATLIYMILLAMLFNDATPQVMRTQACQQDSGRWGFLWAAIFLSVIVMVSLGAELHGEREGGTPAYVLAAVSIVLSWLFMNSMFALHYAHGYYGDYGKKHAGLEFPDTPQPDYWDFAYFAIVIGMTFQVSDVQITSRYLRRVALLHSVIAFFFNVFIIALSVNVVAGKA